LVSTASALAGNIDVARSESREVPLVSAQGVCSGGTSPLGGRA
jgi:hypothetical protein